MKPRTYTDEHGNHHTESDGKNDPVIVYAWEVRAPKRFSGWRKLTWKMTEDAAAAWAKTNGAEIRVVEGSEEVRMPVEGWGSPHGKGGLGDHRKRRSET
jgi:hypothetical protein